MGIGDSDIMLLARTGCFCGQIGNGDSDIMLPAGRGHGFHSPIGNGIMLLAGTGRGLSGQISTLGTSRNGGNDATCPAGMGV